MLYYFILCTHKANLQWVLSYYRWSPWFNWQYTVTEHLVTPPKRTLSSCFSPLVFQLVVKCDGCPSGRPTLSPKFSDQTRHWMFLLFSEVSEGGFWGKRRNEENWLVALSGGWTFVLSREKEDNCFSLRGELHSYFAGTFIEKKTLGY